MIFFIASILNIALVIIILTNLRHFDRQGRYGAYVLVGVMILMNILAFGQQVNLF